MADGKSHRLNIPASDEKSTEWMANQINGSLAVRVLIQRHVAQFGTGDVFNVLPDAFAGLEGPIRRGPGRPPGSKNRSSGSSAALHMDVPKSPGVEEGKECGDSRAGTQAGNSFPENPGKAQAEPVSVPVSQGLPSSGDYRPDPLADRAVVQGLSQAGHSDADATADTRAALADMLGT